MLLTRKLTVQFFLWIRQETASLISSIFTEEIRNGKLHFLCSDANTRRCLKNLNKGNRESKFIAMLLFWYKIQKICNFIGITLQTLHVYFMLKRRGYVRFLVVLMWNTRGVFAGKLHRGEEEGCGWLITWEVSNWTKP